MLRPVQSIEIRVPLMLAVGIAMAVIAMVGPSFAGADADENVPPPGLPVYYPGESGLYAESDLLVGTPGTTPTLAAGLFNPAAFSMLESGGVYFSWRDMVALRDDPKDWLGIASGQNLAFAMQRFQLRDGQGEWDHLDEYTLALSWGDGRTGTGLAYSWNQGGCDLMTRHERLSAGTIQRWDWLSVGTASVFDMERKNHYVQADLGVRPLGPRLTLFADAVYAYRDEFEDIDFGYGLEAWPLPGVCVAGKLRDDGDYSVRLDVSFGQDRLGGRLHADNDGDHVATTYAVEVSRKLPDLGHGFMHQKSRYPELSLKGSTVYRTYEWFDDRRRLLPTLHTIEYWAKDPQVGGLVLNLSGMRINPALMWELREQLAGFRAAGKTVTVYFDRLWLGTYALASVADEVWMDPVGSIDIRGLAMGRTYMARMLEKVGVEFDEFRFFDYKSAAEVLTRTSMSDGQREQLTDIMDDWFDTYIETICTARGMSREAFERLMNEKAQLYGEEVLAAGLVDSLGSYKRVKERARKVESRPTGDVASTDIRGVGGDYLWDRLAWGEPDRIAVIYGIGECAMQSGIKGPQLAKTIKRAGEDPNVAAIVFRADSPGGDPLPSDLVAREIKKAAEKKPVIVSQGMVAGSGGYWISMYGDSILASPFTITGSIGVIGGHLYDTELGKKTGLDYDFVKTGEHADADRGFVVPLIGQEVPHRPYTAEERERAKEIILALYDDFVEKVAEGRDMATEEVAEIAQGRVYSGARGSEIGLVDEVGGLWESIAMAKAAAGLDAEERVRLTEAPSLGKFRFPSFGFGFGLGSLLGLGDDTQEGVQDGSHDGLFGQLYHCLRDRLGDDFDQGLDTGLLSSPLGRRQSRQHQDVEALPAGPYQLDVEDSLVRQVLGDDLAGRLSAEDRLYLEQMLRAPGRPLLMMEPYPFETSTIRAQ